MRITPDDAASGQARSIPSLRVHINQSAGWKAWCRAHVAEGSRQGSEEARAFISEGVTVWNFPRAGTSTAGLSPCYVRRICIMVCVLVRMVDDYARLPGSKVEYRRAVRATRRFRPSVLPDYRFELGRGLLKLADDPQWRCWRRLLSIASRTVWRRNKRLCS